MADRVKEEQFLNSKIKPELQEIIKNIEIEEKDKSNRSDIGECVMYFMEEQMLSHVMGLSLGNRPHGFLFLGLKFSMYIIKVVKSTDLLSLGPNH